MMQIAALGPWFDQLGRPLQELRVSVTDRCNFRCRYCMPREHFGPQHRYVPRDQILSFEEILRVVTILHTVGLRKVRLTGGEPLLREDLCQLVRQLKDLPRLELAMTTNGSILPQFARSLKNAGLDRITVSLDALDNEVFRRTSDSRYSVDDVLSAIDAAVAAGFASLKINCVVKRGMNDDQILPLVERFRDGPHELRFIEFMDTGETPTWSRADVFTADEILSCIESCYPLEPLEPANYGQTSRMYKHTQSAGRVGIIASVSHPFCGSCTRARLTARGELHTCLFAQNSLNLRHMLRSGLSDGEIYHALFRAWSKRADRYSELRASHGWSVSEVRLRESARQGRPEMSYLGG